MRTLEEVPDGATHWSKRELAKRVGISPTSVLRIWRAFGLQPWRTEDFKKPQIQALERTAPVLPMIPGTPERRSFDYLRYGTVDLFAALNTATGKVIGKLSAQHRAVDFRDFLDEIDRQTEPGLAVPVMCSLNELKTALEDWIKPWNNHARPFKWTMTADQIIDRICRYCDRVSGPGR